MLIGLVLQDYFSSANSSRLLRASSSLEKMPTGRHDSRFIWIPKFVKGFEVLDSSLAERGGCNFACHMVPHVAKPARKFVGGRNCKWASKGWNWEKQGTTGSFFDLSDAPCSLQAWFIIRFQSREYFRCKLASSLTHRKFGLSNLSVSLRITVLFGSWNLFTSEKCY